MPGWTGKNGIRTDNARSVIDPSKEVSKEFCMIGIYSSQNSRFIIIETGDVETRKIYIYTGSLNLIPAHDEQPVIWDWQEISEGSLSDQAGRITALRTSTETPIEFRITAEDCTKFKAALESPMEDNPVEGNLFDQSIRKAGNAINRIIDIENDISLFESCRIL